jgi:hypothetical protein
VGISLASGSGILTKVFYNKLAYRFLILNFFLQLFEETLGFVKEDEIEGVCSEIRQAVGRTSLLHSNLNVKVTPCHRQV